MDLPMPPEWTRQALCAQIDYDIFFPPQGGSSKPAKTVCAMCEVRAECLAYAIANNERHGIWGGVAVGKAPRRDAA